MKLKLQLWKVSDNVWDVCLPSFSAGGELLIEGTVEDLKAYAAREMQAQGLNLGVTGFAKVSSGELKSVQSDNVYLMIDLNLNNTLVRLMHNPVGKTQIQRPFWKGSLMEVFTALEVHIKQLENANN